MFDVYMLTQKEALSFKELNRLFSFYHKGSLRDYIENFKINPEEPDNTLDFSDNHLCRYLNDFSIEEKLQWIKGRLLGLYEKELSFYADSKKN